MYIIPSSLDVCVCAYSHSFISQLGLTDKRAVQICRSTHINSMKTEAGCVNIGVRVCTVKNCG